MRLLRVGPVGEERPAIQYRDELLDVSALISDFDMRYWTESPDDVLTLALNRPELVVSIDQTSTRIGAPVPRPSKIVCIGHNYVDHIRESSAEIPNEPVVFMKAPNTVIGPNDDVAIPPGSAKTDYEIELGVVIGRTCRYLPNEDAAREAIGGYVVSNDLSERSYQLDRGGQWVKGKSFETFNPLGPVLVTGDEVPDPQDLNLELKINGHLRQSSDTSQMLFPVSRSSGTSVSLWSWNRVT